jgi:hypothetical protein
MIDNPDNFLSQEDLAWERSYFSLMADLKRNNLSRYEKLAGRLSAGGEEILELPTGIYKISVDNNGCGYSCQESDGINFQRLGWMKLTENPDERIAAITDALAECEARAQIDS